MAEIQDKQTSTIERLTPFIVVFLLIMLAIVGWWKDHPTVSPYYSLFGQPRHIGELYLFITNIVFACLVSFLLAHLLKQRRAAQEEADHARLSADSLKISQQRLSDIIEKSPWVIVQHGFDGRLEDANPAAEQLFKQPKEKSIGTRPRDWVHPEDYAKTMEAFTAIARGEEGHVIENRTFDSEGKLHHMRWTGTPRLDTEGRINGVISFGINITAEVDRRIERDRLASEQEQLVERLWVLNDFARSLRTTLDAEGLYRIAIQAVSNVLPGRRCAILIANRATACLDVVAYRCSDPQTPQIPALVPGHSIASMRTDLWETVLSCKQRVTPDLESAEKPHEKALAEAGCRSRIGVPIMVVQDCIGLLIACTNEPGAPPRETIEFMQGVAEHLALALTNSRLYAQQVEATRQVEETQAQMVQVEKLRAVGEMASGIAHDFNNSLAAVIGYAELLEEEPLTDEQQSYIKNILTASLDAATTVRRIQQYARRSVEPETHVFVDVNSLVRDAVALTRHKWKNQAQSRGANIDVQMSLGSDLPAIKGNPTELREVLTNLIFNAVDAIKEAGVIRLQTSIDDGFAEIAVEDTGSGMPGEVLEKIFAPFYSTKGRQGHGLGLSVSEGIIRRHNGHISASSEPGKGSRFELRLPLPSTKLEAGASGETAPDTICVKALVVEDDPAVLDVVGHILQRLGSAVVPASSAEEAIERLREQRFDVVVTDLGMPGMSGRELALETKRMAPGTPVVLLTGWGEQIKAEEPLPDGVDLVLGKPVRMEELREALYQVCGKTGNGAG